MPDFPNNNPVCEHVCAVSRMFTKGSRKKSFSTSGQAIKALAPPPLMAIGFESYIYTEREIEWDIYESRGDSFFRCYWLNQHGKEADSRQHILAAPVSQFLKLSSLLSLTTFLTTVNIAKIPINYENANGLLNHNNTRERARESL